MAVLKMSKFQLVYFDKERKKLLKSLQAFDQVHINDLEDEEKELKILGKKEGLKEEINSFNSDLEDMDKLIKVLETYYPIEPSLKEKLSDGLAEVDYGEAEKRLSSLDMTYLRDRIVSLKKKIRDMEEEIEERKKRVSQLRPWRRLDIPLSELKKLKKVRAYLGTIPSKYSEEFKNDLKNKLKSTYCEFFCEEDKLLHIMILEDGRDQDLVEILREYEFSQVDLGGEKMPAELIEDEKEKIEEANEEINKAQLSLGDLSKSHLMDFKLYYEFEANDKSLKEAEEKIIETEYINLMEGYVPERMEEDFKKLVKEELKMDYILDISETDKEDDQAPIILENNKIVSPFESIVSTYALPLYSELDPTPLMSPWYMLFFGMMLGDLGYGLILLIISSLALKFLDLSESRQKSMRFLQILSIPTMIAGLVFGSFLGGIIEMPALVNPQEDYMELIVFSISLGVVNILFGLGILAYEHIRAGRPFDALVDTGFWYMILIGLIAFFLGKFQGWSEGVTKAVLIVAIVGMVGVVIFSHREDKGFSRYAWGLYDVYGVSSYVGDFVSFVRITALLLSGSFIGLAVNLIAKMVSGAIFPLGIIFAILIFVVFHLFNLFLSGLSAYVHSMRLIYVEYFGKFYQGGGKAFKGLRSPAKYIKIK